MKTIIIGSEQRNAYRGRVKGGISPCLTAAMGLGGGQIPIIIEVYDETNKDRHYKQ